MFGLLTKKQFEKEIKKISKSFERVNNKIIEKEMIELLIDNKILKNNAVIPRIPQTSAQTPQTSPRTPQTKLRKKANKILNKAEIMAEMRDMIKLGRSTMEIYDIIVEEKQLCKKTCFYNYIKQVRELISQTPQTTPQTTQTKTE